jgi:hypothetical protein
MKANKIYAGLIDICEQKAKAGLYMGDGDQLAQELVLPVLIELLPKNQRKIYNALNHDYQTSKQISRKTGIPTKEISVLVRQIEKGGHLVSIADNLKSFGYKLANV